MQRAFSIVAGLLAFALCGTSWAAGNATHHPSVTKTAPKSTASKPPAGAGMMGGMSMDQMMKMMGTMHPAIAVDDTSIYIIRGSELLKLDKNTLQVVSRTMLPTMQMSGMNGSMVGGVGSGPGMQAMMQMPSPQFEQAFLKDMIRHHAGAVAMSEVVVRKAVHPELRQFAQRVIDTQSQEIQEMSRWLKSWYNASVPAMAMPMGEQTTIELRSLSGSGLEIRYMQAMITHHQDAVNMARMAEQKAIHPELKSLASNIVTGQTVEINQLSQWLSDWYNVSPQP